MRSRKRVERFATLVADPPWKFSDKLPSKGGTSRGAARIYPVMKPAEIMAYPLPPMLDDAFLFLWRVASMQQEALDVVEAWGFKVKTEITWVKTRSERTTGNHYGLMQTGSLAFGMGRVATRGSHETCIVATRGKPQRLLGNIRSVFFAPRGRHSAKPEEFYSLVEQLAPGPRVELFARTSREGWTQFGHEIQGRPSQPERRHGPGDDPTQCFRGEVTNADLITASSSR